MSTFIFGHKNPDTDSVTSAIALSNLKNKLGHDTKPCILDNPSKETQFVLDRFNVETPHILKDVKTQLKDSNFSKVEGVSPTDSILSVYNFMHEKNVRTLSITDGDNKLMGIVTMKDIAMRLIQKNSNVLTTSIQNIASDLEGRVMVEKREEVEGCVYIGAFYRDTLDERDLLDENTIMIVGDRYDVIELSIQKKVALIILTGGADLPSKYIQMAEENNVSIIWTNLDTYSVSRVITQCNYISSIMNTSNLVCFNEDGYLDEVKEEMFQNKHSNYPVLDAEGKYLGFVNRSNILNPDKKKVILVDHNEYAQSVTGLDEAEILEIVDHHKIGGIATSAPINFRNMTVGSTCTIVYNMYKEYNVELDKKTAGLLFSGMLSDTLVLKSPTTTDMERKAVEELSKVLGLDAQEYAMEMFKAGTSLEGQSIEDIFFTDCKEFTISGHKVVVSQVFTLDIDAVMDKKDEFISFIDSVNEEHCNHLSLMVVTDILKNGSYLFYKCDSDAIVSMAFNCDKTQGTFVDGIVSRKKQVIPKLSNAYSILKD